MKISVIVTVYNEAETIERLLVGLAAQTVTPAEVVIVDAGSTDDTQKIIKKFAKNQRDLPIRLIVHPGNRSLGRNIAVKQAKHDWLAITDAGCIPYPDWLEQLLQKQRKTNAEVVAGYYDALPATPFEEAVVPYVLVMPDQVDEQNFLPATRSMLIKKSVWLEYGGLHEQLEVSEDYEFARRLKKARVRMAMAPQAVVTWLPRKTIGEFYRMVKSMACGDARARIIRKKVWLVFARYVVGAHLVGWYIGSRIVPLLSTLILVAIALSFFIYLVWAIAKNKRHVTHGWYWLPILQILADLAVMTGTIHGLRSRYRLSPLTGKRS